MFAAHKVGYGNLEALQREIKNDVQFRFNWYLKSRSMEELGNRVDTLLHLIQKENAAASKKATTGKRGRNSDTSKKVSILLKNLSLT